MLSDLDNPRLVAAVRGMAAAAAVGWITPALVAVMPSPPDWAYREALIVSGVSSTFAVSSLVLGVAGGLIAGKVEDRRQAAAVARALAATRRRKEAEQRIEFARIRMFWEAQTARRADRLRAGEVWGGDTSE